MELMKRDGGMEMEMEVAPPDVPGSLEWLAKEIYGGEEKLVEAMVGALASQGSQADPRMAAIVRGWKDGGRRLNELVRDLGMGGVEVIAWLQERVGESMKVLGQLRAQLMSRDVLDFSYMAAQDPEKGFADRQMLLTIAGLVQGKGPLVTIDQRSIRVGGKDELRDPLLKFRETMVELDDMARGEIVEGEIVEDV